MIKWRDKKMTFSHNDNPEPPQYSRRSLINYFSVGIKCKMISTLDIHMTFILSVIRLHSLSISV